MPINISTSNYINTQMTGTGNSQNVSAGVSASAEGAVVSVKGLDLQPGQTLSGQVVEIEGKDIKLLLSNNQTINAKLEGNINALLGQTLSFEVKNTDNGQTALRPLYTNLDNSQTVTNALKSANLPVTPSYAHMVSSMMDEGMPINKQAIYDMSKQINNFPTANPETIVKLNKLGLQINELTINQYENYKGFEHQIKSSVDTISKGLSDVLQDSLKSISSQDGDLSKLSADTLNAAAAESSKASGKNLLSAFLNALTGTDNSVEENIEEPVREDIEAEAGAEEAASQEGNGSVKPNIEPSAFDTARMVFDMVDTEGADEVALSDKFTESLEDLKKTLLDNNLLNKDAGIEAEDGTKSGSSVKDNLLNELRNEVLAKNGIEIPTDFEDSGKITSNDALNLAKNALNELARNPEKFPAEVREKLAKLVGSKEFGNLVKDNISKQMLLKPEDVVSQKNIDDLYGKILKNANQAVELMHAAGKDNPELMNAAKNIADNVTFMNELNQVVTYIQLPLLMNNKSAHGDLYVYTNKKSLKNNDGNVSALLHLDMDNLGPMDIYVALTNGTKVNTHFYLKDEATIDFIEAHIDYLNKRLTEKGYDMSLNVSVKDPAKGKTDIAQEFFKDDPLEEGVKKASKFSFDVRA